jgi:uncharacterized protein YndB with AHSA1/START domain
MIKWLIIVVLAIAAAVAIAALVGSLLPRGHHASREQSFAAPPEALWSAITNVDDFPRWRTDISKVQSLPDRDGRRMWVEESRSGKMTFVVESSDPARRLITRIADPDLPFGGTWTYEIAASNGGSRLTITENGEIYNPMFRFVARFILGYEATIESYLDALERKFSGANGA